MLNGIGNANCQSFRYQENVENNYNRSCAFTIKNTTKNLEILSNSSVQLKYITKEFIYFSSTTAVVEELNKQYDFLNIGFEFAPPSLMADSARAHHFVNDVHSGSSPLNQSYTGAGVIVGVVDTGIEIEHADFRNADSSTRIIRYWDQTMADDASSPQPYGYGFVWDSTSINNGTCTSNDAQGHGSTVAGMATGNGLANGYHKGIAPDASIIAIETDFSRPNWTLTVADACDYVFSVADSLGLPAVVNLSVGSYLGSHDGNDPASVLMEQLIDDKPGRIIIGAAGNSGNLGKYHAHNDVTGDTNFVWIKNNPSGSQGPNTILIDVWTDTADANFSFSFGADTELPSWDFRGRTLFHDVYENLGGTVYDTIWNGNNRIATIEAYPALENGNYNLVILANIDSTSYRYRFETTGSGNWDLWSGTGNGLNDLYSDVPTVLEFPAIANYIQPDAEQTIVSSWNCSEKIISVGNFTNRSGHTDKNLNQYAGSLTVGLLSVNSSKGPNRHGVIKPEISAAGDISFGAAPLFYITNPAYNSGLDSSGLHARNGGTSMASPVIAGIAALYLERCGKANYQNFINDLTSNAYSDGFTGVTPNNAYGYGKANAFLTLQDQEIPNTPILSVHSNGTIESTLSDEYQWYMNDTLLIGENQQVLFVTPPLGSYFVEVINSDGCNSYSDSVRVYVGIEEHISKQYSFYPNPSSDEITINGDYTILKINAIDMSGKKFKLDRTSENRYNITNLQEGVYILEIQSDKGFFTFKFVKN